MRIILSVLALVFFASPPAAAACTEMWCLEGLRVDLAGTSWPAGEYRFIIDADGRSRSCTARLPFPDCESLHAACSAPGVTIGESGCALPPEQQSFSDITLQNIPQSFSVRIEHDSGKVFEYQGDVQRMCTFPNGPQCDERQCCSAVLDTNVVWK